jgi:uncharacterized low-complexity protein
MVSFAVERVLARYRVVSRPLIRSTARKGFEDMIMKKSMLLATLGAASLLTVACASTPEPAPAAEPAAAPAEAPAAEAEKAPEGSCGGEKAAEGSCGGEKAAEPAAPQG